MENDKPDIKSERQNWRFVACLVFIAAVFVLNSVFTLLDKNNLQFMIFSLVIVTGLSVVMIFSCFHQKEKIRLDTLYFGYDKFKKLFEHKYGNIVSASELDACKEIFKSYSTAVADI